MGRVVTPTYRVETTTNVGRLTDMAWNCKRDGRPTAENLEEWRKGYNRSFLPGGVNGPRHDSDVILHISSARIVRQSTGKAVAEVRAPMFEVV